MMRIVVSLLVSGVLAFSGCISFLHKGENEIHVAVNGSDLNDGSKSAPLRTIQAAAEKAMPGDTVTVHAGVYRERVNPPRGGESATKRIVYQAAPGEQVVITGSEAVKQWEKVQDGVWKTTLPNTFFGSFNPFAELISGDWFDDKGRSHHAGAVYLNGDWLTEAVSREEVMKPMTAPPLWFASVDTANTVIWAQFKDVDPNAQQVEVNARRSVFYPEKSGMNYITVRGFTLRNAATPWAPPTVEQIGLIGVHWSKGWIIENNDIAYSTCSGITLGKYGDAKDQNSGSAKGYVTTIERGLKNGWNKETIGHHVVRNNHISHCEQVGIVGSLGAAFSTVTGNTIHDIHVRQLFSGAEMAGIKFHGPIDVTISRNHIYRTCRGIWLDWMTQGARISNNLCHDNEHADLFVEVNHGPFVVDNNLFLSPKAIEDDSQGGAYNHNLIAGGIDLNPTFYDGRKTPFHKAHSTEVVALHDNPSGDSHYDNNLFMRSGSLEKYDQAHLPMWMDGNVFFQGAKSSKHESAPIKRSASDPGLTLVEKNDGYYLTMTLATALGSERPSKLVTSARLGKASISGCAFENPDGSPIMIGTDYFGKPRNADHPTPGPFEAPGTGVLTMKVWPLAPTEKKTERYTLAEKTIQQAKENLPKQVSTEKPLAVKGGRFLTLNTVIRVNQIEAARNLNEGTDEAAVHTPETVAAFRDAVSKGFPGAKVTWAFSWLALHDERPNYDAIRKQVAGYHKTYGDEVTFIPGGFFAPMYSSRAQVNLDIKEALLKIRDMVGNGYKPKSLVAGFLSAENLRYLAEEEGIHVCQGTIWSQYGIDNGDGDGSISYPYYPSREHACKPAQGKADFIDCVNLDGWTCDFLCARRFGFEGGFNSRLGVGPIESYRNLGVEKGIAEVMAVTANHFDDGFKRNGFGWVANCWEISLVKNLKPEVLPCLTQWLQNVRQRWPDAQVVTQGEFGEAWRREYPDNNKLDYTFVQRGTGIGGSETNLEIRWFMNTDFRLAILRDWQKEEPGKVIDFTRYDLQAREPADPTADKPTRNWSLINRINQKHRRPEDVPVPLKELTEEEQALIKKRYPELF